MRSSRINCSLTVEFLLVQENILLQNERITQLYVIQSEQDPFKWFGVLFVDSGIYMGAVVQFTMFINDSYPDCPCPRIVFDPIPHHPLVDPETGELDTKNAFPDWSSNTKKLHQLLLFVKRVICQADTYMKQIQELISQHMPDASAIDKASLGYDINALNQTKSHARLGGDSGETEEINQLIQGPEHYDQHLKDLFANFSHTLELIKTYENDSDEFQRRIETFKQDCCHKLFEKPKCDDRNALVFSPWNSDIHEPIRSCVLAGRFAPTNLFASYNKETDSVSFVPGSETSQ